MRSLLALIVLAAPAAADPVPGTGGDPLRALMLDPAFTYSDAPSGLPVRGGNPEDTVLLFDGFELPWAFHDGGVRSIVPADAADPELAASTFGVEYGRGGSVVTLSPRNAQHALFGELTVLDIHAHAGTDNVATSVRVGNDLVADEWRDNRSDTFGGALAHLDLRVTTKWTVATSVIAAVDSERELYRLVTGASYRTREWLATLAVSPLSASEPGVERFALDTRAELVRQAAAAAGLTKLEWRLGQQTNSTHYDVPERRLWRNDVGLWSSLAGNLSSRVRAVAGLRVDNFDGDVATQPRGSVTIGITRHLEIALAAGAYRRPPRAPTEVALGLNPERATHLVASGTFDSNHGYRITGAAYYIDRRRLIARDDAGTLGNTGVGTSVGAELTGAVREGPWFGRLATALASSQRTDFPRARERPAPYEQPFRLELLGGWTRKQLTLSARLQLASGLPYTPYDGAIYDSDTDTWQPRFVEPLSARTPFHHQIDLRFDVRFTLGSAPCVAFIDLHNAYASERAIGYVYSYDFAQRAAITALPLFPFAGLRAYL